MLRFLGKPIIQYIYQWPPLPGSDLTMENQRRMFFWDVSSCRGPNHRISTIVVRTKPRSRHAFYSLFCTSSAILTSRHERFTFLTIHVTNARQRSKVLPEFDWIVSDFHLLCFGPSCVCRRREVSVPCDGALLAHLSDYRTTWMWWAFFFFFFTMDPGGRFHTWSVTLLFEQQKHSNSRRANWRSFF